MRLFLVILWMETHSLQFHWIYFMGISFFGSFHIDLGQDVTLLFLHKIEPFPSLLRNQIDASFRTEWRPCLGHEKTTHTLSWPKVVFNAEQLKIQTCRWVSFIIKSPANKLSSNELNKLRKCLYASRLVFTAFCSLPDPPQPTFHTQTHFLALKLSSTGFVFWMVLEQFLNCKFTCIFPLFPASFPAFVNICKHIFVFHVNSCFIFTTEWVWRKIYV